MLCSAKSDDECTTRRRGRKRPQARHKVSISILARQGCHELELSELASLAGPCGVAAPAAGPGPEAPERVADPFDLLNDVIAEDLHAALVTSSSHCPPVDGKTGSPAAVCVGHPSSTRCDLRIL